MQIEYIRKSIDQSTNVGTAACNNCIHKRVCSRVKAIEQMAATLPGLFVVRFDCREHYEVKGQG